MSLDTDSEMASELSSAPSSPLSTPPSSPSPPPDMPLLPPSFFTAPYTYPSPPASQQSSHSTSPVPDGMESGATTDRDGPPPAKRRRVSREQKERTTTYLRLPAEQSDAQKPLTRVLHALHKRRKIVVIAGAGMSVSAGIPDFRSTTGLFKSLKDEHKLKGSGKHLFDASVYKDDSSTSSFHSMVSSMSRLTRDAKPTLFHHMLATIAKEDRLLRLYSQNVDGIDTALEPLKTVVPLRKGDNGKWPRTVQLHGGLDKMVCSKCNDLSDFDADLFAGPTPPTCPRCEEVNDIRTNHEGKRSHGIGRLRPRMVLYNEHNPDDEAIGSVTREDLRKRPDAIIVVGTTLKVPGVRRIVREMCGIVRDRKDGIAIWINNDLPPVAKELEDCFDIVVQGDCDDIAALAAMRRWDEPLASEDFSEVSDEDAKLADRITASVWLPAKLPTPPYLESVEPYTENHNNNSFRPVQGDATPKRPIRTPDYSPISTRKPSVVPSVKAEMGRHQDVDLSSGLPTPSRSRKSTPAIGVVPFNEKLKAATKQKRPSTGGMLGLIHMQSKKSSQKSIKSGMIKSKSSKKFAKKPQTGPTQNLTTAFRVSKTASLPVKTISSKTSPCKPRQTSSPSKPSSQVTPSKGRSHTSPLKRKPFFPSL